ncbi:MAG: phenylacetate--CoA ligase [Deltaproteobacteria bacterium]|nr:phenylacetate--CoA ligase [Deltaproteobacteria bacterium]
MPWDQTKDFLSNDELAALQTARLRVTLTRAAAAPFYRAQWQAAGLDPAQIRGPEDIGRLPFTTKHDLRAGFPDGFLAVPREEVVRVHVSSGTTGAPTAVYHTAGDLDRWAGLVARCLWMVGLRPADVFQNMVGYGLFSGGLGLHYGAEKLGALVIPSGVGNSRRQISLMRQFHTTAAHIIPSYALKLAQTFGELGLDPARDSDLRLLVVGAEPHSEATRRRLEEIYGARAMNCYGLSEMNGPGVAFECPEQNGLHLWEDAYLLEVVDPVTLAPVAPGEVGELVLTTLEREAMPLVRYRTRDLASVLPGRCACGRNHRRISRITGRSDDMFIVKGVNIFPMQVEAVLMTFGELAGNYLIELDRRGPDDVVTVRAELREGREATGEEGLGLARKLTAALKDEILVTPRVELAPLGSLPAAEGKAVRVRDSRPAGA